MTDANVALPSLDEDKPGERPSPHILLLPASSTLRAVAGAGSLALMCRIGAVAAAFVVHVTLARLLTLQEYGSYSYVISWLNVLVVVAMFGMDRAALRFPAQYLVHDDHHRLNGFFNRSSQIAVAGGLSLSVLLLLVVLVQGVRITPSLLHGFVAAAVLLPLLALSLLKDAKLIGIGRVVPGLLGNPLRLAGLWVLVLTASAFVRLSAPRVIALQILATIVALLVSSCFLGHWRRESIPTRDAVSQTRQWLLTAFPLMVVVLLNVGLNRSGTILTGSFLGTADAALYDVGARLCEAILLAYHAVNSVVAPRFAAYYASSNDTGLEQIAKASALATAVFGLLASAVLLLFGRFVLRMFGPEFVGMYYILPVMLIGPLSLALSGPAVYLLNSTNGQVVCALAYAMAVAIQVALAPVLLLTFGIVGVAVSTAISQVICHMALVYFVRHRLGFWPFMRLPRLSLRS